jgi:hypothetical protein
MSGREIGNRSTARAVSFIRAGEAGSGVNVSDVNSRSERNTVWNENSRKCPTRDAREESQ